MKKTITFALVIMVITMMSACKKKTDPSEEAILNDTIAPLIQIRSTERRIAIWQGETYDLMEGVTGLDNLEGTITSRIQINFGDYDPNIPGVYEVFFFLSDRAGNAATPMSKIITVRNATTLAPPPVYLGTVLNEAPKPPVPNCFQGAWYHKVFSAKDRYYGIEGTITLPLVDINRYESNYNTDLRLDPNARNLDNPSIYMGGHATTESDVGLSLSRVCMGEECRLSTGGMAFRPFWRYITNVDFDEGGYEVHNNEYAVSCRAQGNYQNCIANWHFRDTQFYYLPGDKIRMLVYSPMPNYLQMQIQVLEVSTHPESVALRAENGWLAPANFFSPFFSSPGHGTGMNAEYKRVNAIDQASNEGKPIIETTSFVEHAYWHESYLYRMIDNEMRRVPMTSDRVSVMNCPYSDRFTVTYDGVDPALGGEVVEIHPAGPRSTSTQAVACIVPKKEE